MSREELYCPHCLTINPDIEVFAYLNIKNQLEASDLNTKVSIDINFKVRDSYYEEDRINYESKYPVRNIWCGHCNQGIVLYKKKLVGYDWYMKHIFFGASGRIRKAKRKKRRRV